MLRSLGVNFVQNHRGIRGRICRGFRGVLVSGLGFLMSGGGSIGRAKNMLGTCRLADGFRNFRGLNGRDNFLFCIPT